MNELRCRCGALLPVGGPPQVLPRCPSCREPYGFPTYGTDSPTPPQRTPLALGLTMSAGALGLALLLFFAVWKLTRSPLWRDSAPSSSETNARATLKSRPFTDPLPAPPPLKSTPPREDIAPPAPASAPATPPENEVLAAFVRINRVVVRCNIAGVVAAVLVNSGRATEAEDLQEILLKGDLEIRREMDKLPPIAAHLEPGDLLFYYDTCVLDMAKPVKFAEDIQKRLRDLQVGMTVPASVKRKGQVVPISIYLPEIPPEIAEILARVVPRPAPVATTTAPSSEIRPLPPDLLQDIRFRLALLPETYVRALSAGDAARLKRLLARGEGTGADEEFLQKTVQAELLPRVEEENRQLKIRAAELQTKVSGAPEGDALVFRDGRKVRGKIEEETADSIKFRGSLGVARYARSEIARIERQDTAGEFGTRFQPVRGKVDQLLPLLEWCRSRNLTLQKDLVCATILLLDPSREEARKELGLLPLAWR